jgi:hypothetical protein
MRIRPPNTVHILRELFATGLDVVDEAEPPIAPINVFPSIGVYELKFARGKTDQELDIGTMNLQTPKSHLSHSRRFVR